MEGGTGEGGGREGRRTSGETLDAKLRTKRSLRLTTTLVSHLGIGTVSSYALFLRLAGFDFNTLGATSDAVPESACTKFPLTPAPRHFVPGPFSQVNPRKAELCTTRAQVTPPHRPRPPAPGLPWLLPPPRSRVTSGRTHGGRCFSLCLSPSNVPCTSTGWNKVTAACQRNG